MLKCLVYYAVIYYVLYSKGLLKLSKVNSTRKNNVLISSASSQNAIVSPPDFVLSFRTGNWGVTKNNYIRTGVSQVLSRLTFGATLSYMRRVVIPIGREGKNAKIRQVHQSQIMYICPVETPEGASIGIVMNLSLLTTVTRRIPTVVVKDIIESADNLVSIDDYKGPNDKPKIFLNGILMGITLDASLFIEEMKAYRKNGLLDKQVSFTFDPNDNEIRIFCDEGRFIRPVFTTNDKGLLNISETDNIDWDELVEKEMIQYIDNSEIQNSVVAMEETDLFKYKNDFCEICPATMLGVMANVIPYPDHNQCIFKDEPVYMANGTVKKICEVQVGDKVITFNPDTQKQSVTTVIYTYTNLTEKLLYRITTISGRQIRATYDHQFMTSNGWKRAYEILDDLDSGGLPLIGISLEPKPVSIIPCKFGNIIEPGFHYKKESYMFRHLLGLSTKSYYELPIVSRMIGFTFFNKIHINDEGFHYFVLNFQEKKDMEDFENDADSLQLRGTRFAISPLKILYEGAIPTFLKLIGDSGDIPEWIMKGSDMVKREFLAGFNYSLFGGFTHELQQGDYFKMRHLSNQVIELLQDLRINGEFYIEHLPHEMCKVNFILRASISNAVDHYEIINFRYNRREKVNVGLWVEYTKYRRNMMENNSEFIGFDKWKSIIKIKETTLFVPVYNFEPVSDCIISDITVDSPNQSFLCGDVFCVHNSPRNIYQCLDPETDVTMADGNKKPIKDVKIGDEVITFHPTTLELSKTRVIHQYVRETENKIYKLRTVSGREIVATGNHNFMTTSGWLPVEKMIPNETKIGISLLQKPVFVSIESITEIPNQLIADITVESENHSFIAGDGFLSSNSSMGKQAIGFPVSTYQIRTDTVMHVLDYPQRPLISTIPAKLMGFEAMPAGINCIVAIGCYTGFFL